MNPDQDKQQILFVDDDPYVRSAMNLVLRSGGYGVEVVASGGEALAAMEKRPFDLVVTDHRMPGMSGMELALAIKASMPSMPVVMFTGYPPAEGIPCLDLVITKPSDTPTILQSLKQILGKAGSSSPPSSESRVEPAPRQSQDDRYLRGAGGVRL
jgi:CheY-like chemotaxis protein